MNLWLMDKTDQQEEIFTKIQLDFNILEFIFYRLALLAQDLIAAMLLIPERWYQYQRKQI